MPVRRARTGFHDTNKDRVYLTYFAAGDLHTLRHGRAIRADGGSTHPAQLTPIFGLFGKYCKPIVYPCYSKFGYAWRIVCIVDESFAFLLTRTNGLKPHKLIRRGLFFSALSGFFDAEGAICVRESSGRPYPVLALSNRKRSILQSFQLGLREEGYRAQLYGLTGKGGTIQWQLEVVGLDATRLLKRPDLRHREKFEAKALVQSYAGKPWREVGPLYRGFRDQIDANRDKCISAAHMAYLLRSKRKNQKAELLRKRMTEAKKLREAGQGIELVAKAIGKSPRTIYRWLRTTHNGGPA